LPHRELLETANVSVKSSAMLCTGTKIDGQGTADPDAQHVCYKGVGAPHRTSVGVEDRFGLHTLDLSRADSLCLRSEP